MVNKLYYLNRWIVRIFKSLLAKIIRKLVNNVGIGTISTTFPSNHELSGKYVYIYILLGFKFCNKHKKGQPFGLQGYFSECYDDGKEIFPFFKKRHCINL